MVTADEGQPPLWVRLLGPVRAGRGNRELKAGGPQRQAVLGLLAMRANQAVSRDELIDGVWGGDRPSSAVNALHVHVAGLRRALEPRRAIRAPGQVLPATGPGYSLCLEPGQLDAELFSQHLDAARRSRAAGELSNAARWLDAALQLWQAAPLAGVPGPWAGIERARLDEVRLAALEERTELMLMLGRPAQVTAELASLVREHPLREGLRGQLMLALYRCGRQADALAAFADARAVLVEELGIEPGPGLRQLHEQILAADAALDQPATTAPAIGRSRSADPATPEQDRPVPAQLPGDVNAFTGRETELAVLDRLAATIGQPGRDGHDDGASAEPSAALIAISGTAGAGKTALALHWAHRFRHGFPDGQLYVNLRGYDPGQPVPAGDALAGFLRALGMPGQDIPRELDERAAAYRTLLDGRRMLVVLDNAGSVEQVRPLLPGSPSNLVLVTSRDSLAGLVARHGARRLDLNTLPPHDAFALLQTLIGGRAEAQPDATTTLARQCAQLPLALRVAAELAAARPAMTVAQLADELTDEQQRLHRLDAGGDPGSAVRGVLSWSYHHLPAEPARAFRLLGLHPGPDLDSYATAALTATSHAQARRLLDVLARTHLIHQTRPGRYGMHDLLRAYAADLATADAERYPALTRLFDYYVAAAATAMDTLMPAERHLRPHVGSPAVPVPPVADPAAARAWLDSERAVFVAATARSAAHGWSSHTIRLAGTIYRYLETGGHYTDALTIHTEACRTARRIGDLAAEATALTNLGGIYCQQERYEQAAGHLRQALDLFREIGDHQGEAAALTGLGIIDSRQGRYEQATSQYRQALALAREIGDRPGEVEAHNGIGEVLLASGRASQASAHHTIALAVASRIGDKYEQARAHDGLARTHHVTANSGQARHHWKHALELFTVIGAPEANSVRGRLSALDAAGFPDCPQLAPSCLRDPRTAVRCSAAADGYPGSPWCHRARERAEHAERSLSGGRSR